MDFSSSAEAALEALRARGLRLAVAESCTGGMIMAALSAPPGASSVVECGFMVYSNDSKERLLEVPKPLMIAQGAVSAATAQAMARGALAQSGAQIALGVTGVAGPTGATALKPVGLAHMALAGALGEQSREIRLTPQGEGAALRAAMRAGFVLAALDFLRGAAQEA